MSAWTVEFTTAAARQVRKLDPVARRRVLTAISALALEPRPAGVKKLAGTDHGWRLRTGDYRVLYEIHGDQVLVLVFRVGHRREVYEDR